jgi:hypothetical protein
VSTESSAAALALDEAEQIRRVYEREAGNYDRNVKLPERLLFSGGREWVCARAEGEVLEIAVGTGRNLPPYPDGVRLTGIDFVPSVWGAFGAVCGAAGCGYPGPCSAQFSHSWSW